MKKFTFLLSMLASTTALSIPPYTDLDENAIASTRVALEENPRFASFLVKFNKAVRHGIKAVDWTIIDTFQRKPNDTDGIFQQRKALRELLERSGLLRQIDNYDDETESFNYNPALIMRELLEEPIHILHIGGPIQQLQSWPDEDDPKIGQVSGVGVPRVEVGRFRQISISHDPNHSPDIYAKMRDHRALAEYLSHRNGTTAEEYRPIVKIVMHIHGAADTTTPNLTDDKDYLAWIGALLYTDGVQIAGLEIRGVPYTESLAHRFAPFGVSAIRTASREAMYFFKQPKPNIVITDDFPWETQIKCTPGIGTPIKQRYRAMEGDQKIDIRRQLLKRSAEAYKESGGSNPILEGIPRGWRPEEFLMANSRVLELIMSQVEMPGYDADHAQWERAYGDWRKNIFRAAQELALAAFNGTDYPYLKSCSFGGAIPSTFDWLAYLILNPEIFYEIATEKQLDFYSGAPEDQSAAQAMLSNLNEHMSGLEQFKLAQFVHEYATEDIASFESVNPKRSFRLWRSPELGDYDERIKFPGIDLNTVALNILGNGTFQGAFGNLKARFMLDRGYSERNMNELYVRAQYIDWLHDRLGEYVYYGTGGIAWLPYMVPGWNAKACERMWGDAFRSAHEEGNQGTLFNFPVLGIIDTLAQYLGGETIPNLPFTSFDDPVSRLKFQVWAQLKTLDIIFNPDNDEDFWLHHTALNAPRGWGWKALMRYNDLTEFDSWFALNKPQLDSKANTLTERFDQIHQDEAAGAGTSDATGEAQELAEDAEDKIRQSWHPAYVIQTWWERASQGEELMVVQPTDGGSLVDCIGRHAEGKLRREAAILQSIREGELEGPALAGTIFDLTTNLQGRIGAIIEEEKAAAAAAAAERDRQEAERQRQEAELAAKAEADAKAAAERERQEAERLRQEAERQRLEAERKRLEAERLRREEEEKAAAERLRRQEEAAAEAEAQRKRLQEEAEAAAKAQRERLEAEAAAEAEARRKKLETEALARAAAQAEAERRELEARAAAKAEEEHRRLQARAAAKAEAQSIKLKAAAEARNEAERIEREAAEEAARMQAEAVAKAKAKAERIEQEAAAKARRIEEEAAARAEAEAKARAKREERERQEREARERAEREAREREAKEREERARARAAEEAQRREEEAAARAEAEAKARAKREARERQELEARQRAEREAREREAREREERARARAAEEAHVQGQRHDERTPLVGGGDQEDESDCCCSCCTIS